MDLETLRETLSRYDFHLLTIGETSITVTSIVKLLVSAWILYIVAARLSRWALGKLLARTDMEHGQRAAVMGLVHYTVLIFGAVLILQNAGINLTAFAVVGSALGVGIGFGLQNIISNFISGLIIMLEQPIKVGDRIELAGAEGVVRAIGARRTTVVTTDGTTILVPNQRFITDNVTNYVYLDRAIRLRVPVAVPRSADLRTVERVLIETAKSVGVNAEPAPEVAIATYTADTIGLELWVWYDGRAFARQELTSRLYFAIDDTLRAQQIKTG